MKSKPPYILYALFLVVLIANIGFWLHSKKIREVWNNVPDAPRIEYAALSGLGDREIAYRMTGYFLQNLGNVGGRFESLKEYDYALLEKWFYVAHELDPVSNYVPYMASYYFGWNTEKDAVEHLVPYLADAGRAQEGHQKWRWLAQAVYMARYSLEDTALALSMANELAAMGDKVSPWARQLPAFINLELGNKEAAYGLLIQMLDTERNKLDPAEINTILDIICNRTLDTAEAAENPLCQDLK